ncbi:hypothetical protein [Arthrobacter sp. MMS18-M83]|uniref:hypothetical protein n=1 Tax=Arthrobacter sp. MMS18-M83 TaxID=2996261 RepID=UPI00227AC1BF|nr:hypothetical protein [Arthrobacter sp. MMS18-M83]WAH95778.1 hypothetical protein OW521_15175 [Arthrobacter sp. MMS18-M83]
MNQTSQGPKYGALAPGSAPEAATGAGAPEPGRKTSPKYQAVLGPFTTRDVTVFGSTLLMFVGSLLPMFGGRYNLWNLDNLFFLALGIILPLVVTALFVARRLQPGNVVRIGSLSIDQFASVVASFAVTMFFLATAGAFTVFALVGLIGSVGFLAATVLAPHLPALREDFKDRAEQPAHVVAREAAIPTRKPIAPKPVVPKPDASPEASARATPEPVASAAVRSEPEKRAPETSAPWAPAAAAPTSFGPADPGSSDTVPSSPAATESADVAPAAPAAGDAAVVPAEPARPIGTATQHIGTVKTAGMGNQPSSEQPNLEQTRAHQIIGATVDPATRRDEEEHGSGYEAFWFAVAHPRTVVDEHTGIPVFTIEPGTWVLALEDRGQEFLVQDTDGKVGILRDLSHIERG